MTKKKKEELHEISWKIPEFEQHERTKKWYINAVIIGVILLILAIFTKNFLFAVIILLSAIIITIHDGKEPQMVDFTIDGEGIKVGKKFIDYDEIKNFSVLYKPRHNIKQLYFEYKKPLKHRLSIPLQDENPLQIRNFLLKYLQEDLERINTPWSEFFSKTFKI